MVAYTGKTHTIVGSEAEPGITSRVIHHMQEKIHNRRDVSMYYSYLEIYQEKVSILSVISLDLKKQSAVLVLINICTTKAISCFSVN